MTVFDQKIVQFYAFFFYKFCPNESWSNPDPDSAKDLDPYPDSEKYLDPYLDPVNTDPKQW